MLDRLKILEQNIAELNKFKKENTAKSIKNDIQKQWIIRYGLFESIQIVIDVACHLTSKYNLGNPNNYSDCIDLLIVNKYITSGLGNKLSGMVGLRNLLIHEYVSNDLIRLFKLLDELQDFACFADEVKNVV
jgi:uncharacterized protein YutE (UPF0331/DUF86 family)